MRTSVTSFPPGLGFAFHFAAASSPLVRPYAAARERLRGLAHSDTTTIVIDGYPRCANTFTYASFRHANGENMSISHHLHGTRAFLRAAKVHTPAVLLYRDPVSAGASLMVRQSISAQVALGSYIYLYERTRRVWKDLVLASFEEVTSDISTVVDRVNIKYGTSFASPDSSPATLEAIRQRVLAMDAEDQGASRPETLALPQASRGTASSAARRELERHDLLLKRATRIYLAMVHARKEQ